MTQIGTIQVQTDTNGIIDVPVFSTDDTTSQTFDMLRVGTDGGTGFVPLIDPTDAAYPYIRVQTENNDVLAVNDDTGVLIDSFEDNDLAEWTKTSGTSSDTVDTVTTQVYSGAYACEIFNGDSTGDTPLLESSPGDGLNRYPQPTQEVSFWFYTNNATDGISAITLNDTTDSSAIIARNEANNDSFAVETIDGNGELIEQKSTPLTNTQEWLEYRIDIDHSGTEHRYRVFDSNGSTLVDRTIPRTTFNSSELAIALKAQGVGDVPSKSYFDYFRVV